MTALAALTGFSIALVLVLGWVVLMLRRDIASLTTELRAANDRNQSPVVPPSEPVAAPLAVAEPTTVEPADDPSPSVRTVVSFDGRDDDDQLQRDDQAQPEDVPVITQLAAPVDDVDPTTRRVASVTLARPLIKVAALSYGVRRALDDEHRLRMRLTMKRELKRQRKMRRRRRAGRAPSQGWDQ